MTSMNGKSNRSPNRACIVSWGLGTGGQNSSGKIVSILNPSDDLRDDGYGNTGCEEFRGGGTKLA